jgi:hypothetical protein
MIVLDRIDYQSTTKAVSYTLMIDHKKEEIRTFAHERKGARSVADEEVELWKLFFVRLDNGPAFRRLMEITWDLIDGKDIAFPINLERQA